MGDLINLRHVRKAKARRAAAAKSAERRAEFGVSPAMREAAQKMRALDAKRLGAHLIESAASDEASR